MLAAVRRRLLPFPFGALAAAFSSSTAATTAAAEPAVSFLISRCGLSPAAAARAATSARLQAGLATRGAAARADAVLALLRRYGLSDADVSETVRKLPIVLVSDPAKTLQPKLDYLVSVGISAPLLARLVSLNPILLRRSVQDYLAPFFTTLRDVLGGSETRVVAAIRSMPFVLRCNPKSTFLRGLPLLRDVHGLSGDEIARLVTLQPGVILQNPDRINEVVDTVRRFGVEPGSPKFVYVFKTFAKMKPSTLQSKFALFRRLGFDDDSITRMIWRYPLSMSTSEKKIQETVGFLTSKAGLSLEDIMTYPALIVRRVEGLSQRCAVLAVLRRLGQQSGQHRVPAALMITKVRFNKVYVLPYVEEFPDVLRAMNGEIPFEGFDRPDTKAKRKKMSA
ncbi:hypothetical protein BS78_09G144200 [Paspalum vaginatum]|nr:hypothetical protein BS78_09G144200 [Paspalum vaginatum]